MSISYIPFTELVSEIIDNRGRTCPTSRIGIPLIATNCIKNNGLYPSYEAVRYVSQETYKTWFRGHPQPGDLIFVTKGSPGRVCVTPNPVNFCIAQDMVAIRADKSKVYPKYLFAVLRSEDVQKKIENMHVGTLIPHFKKGDFHKLLLPVPDKEKQILVGDIYYNISDKIELNRRMNETLEAIARALFKEWFVDFEPVRANMENRPSESASPEIAKLFPSEFENGIPKGWTFGTLSDIAFNSRQNINPNEIKTETAYVGLEHIPRKNIALMDWGKSDKAESTKSQFKANDILFGKLRPYFHKVVIAPIDGICSTDILVVRPKNTHHFGETLIHFSSDEIIQYADRLSNGAKMPRTSWSDLAKFEIVIPTKKVSEEFSKFVVSIAGKIKSNINENKNLEQIRDSLLPRLISGKLPVSKIENKAKGETE
jgi:type I restriction enzyme S subunit